LVSKPDAQRDKRTRLADELLAKPLSRDDPVQLAAQRTAQLERIAVLFRRHDPNNNEDWAANALRALVTDFRVGKEAE